MANEVANKVIFNGETLIDLTSDTVAAQYLLTGYTAHDRSGVVVTGTCPYNVDATDANALAGEILSGRTAYVGSAKVTGSMPNIGAVSAADYIEAKAQQYTIPAGYHDGSGVVGISATEQAKIIATNIREGITILGVEGTMTGTEDVVAESPTVTPGPTDQTIVPSQGYNYLAQVTVLAIPYTAVVNEQGGLTYTIGSAPTQSNSSEPETNGEGE